MHHLIYTMPPAHHLSLAMRPIRPTRAGRLLDFLAQLFPPAVYVPAGIASFLTVSLSLQAMAGLQPLRLTGRSVCGAATVVLLSLLMRIYDELKDVESDLRLGRAGDPKYRARPIVTGHIRVEDLVALRWGVTAVLIALNLGLGFPWPLLAFAVAFGMLWLSFKWFFSKAVQRHLLLAFVTHNPLAMVIGGYVVAIGVADFGPQVLSGRVAPLLLLGWLPIAAWETSRKIRHAPDETDYPTYSKVLGWKVAVWLPAVFVTAATACAVFVARASGLGWAFPAAAGMAAAIVIGACIRFRVAPSAATANLRPFAEMYALIVTVGLPVALVLARGLRWS